MRKIDTITLARAVLDNAVVYNEHVGGYSCVFCEGLRGRLAGEVLAHEDECPTHVANRVLEKVSVGACKSNEVGAGKGFVVKMTNNGEP